MEVEEGQHMQLSSGHEQGVDGRGRRDAWEVLNERDVFGFVASTPSADDRLLIVFAHGVKMKENEWLSNGAELYDVDGIGETTETEKVTGRGTLYGHGGDVPGYGPGNGWIHDNHVKRARVIMDDRGEDLLLHVPMTADVTRTTCLHWRVIGSKSDR